MKKILTKFLPILAVTISILVFGFTLWVRDRYVVPILTYHHIGKPSDKSLILNSVSTDSFEKQMAFLK